MFVHRIIFSCGIIFLLSNCGFHPLYQENSSEDTYHLKKIKIQNIPDREGQILYNRLSTLLTPYGSPRHPLYTLSVSLSFTSRGLSIQKDATTSQEAIDLKFTLLLSDFQTGKTLYATNEVLSVNDTISLTAPYSNLVEERNMKERLLEEAAQSIRLHLVSFLSDKSK